MIPIVPAVIPKSQEDVRTVCERVSFSRELHLDVVDGRFTLTPSWPYDPAGEAVAVKSFTDQFTLEVDLMVVDPLPAAASWIAAGADMLVFHVETISLDSFKQFTDSTMVTVGISCHGDTPVKSLLEYAAYADGVQLMGIKEIGAQGQPFDEGVFEKIAEIKQAFPDKPITVDGSVNSDTIKRLVHAGVDRLITGSAVTLQPDPQAAHAALRALINE